MVQFPVIILAEYRMKDLSITIVSYHNEEDVKKAVASIEEHTPESISKQIYIVDNAEVLMQQCVSENAAKSDSRTPTNELAE